MPKLRAQITMSLDGFMAGPDQDEANPLGVGGMRLHQWAFELEAFKKEHGLGTEGEVNASTQLIERMFDNAGAVVMGRNMFGPIRGGWGDESWNGWWGDDPPYHMPVFVLTHHEREPLQMEGGTTFYFVTDGIDSALDQAFEAAGGKDVIAGGGASCLQQCFAAKRMDQLMLSVAPVLLGSGERLLTDLGDADIRLEQMDAIKAPGVTHLKYAISYT